MRGCCEALRRSIPMSSFRIANEGTPLYTVWRGSRAIGASAAAAVLGKDPYKSQMAIWEYITKRREKDPQSPAMLEGLEAEPELRALYETAVNMEGEAVNLLDAEHDYLRAQIDWLDYNQESACEIKFTRNKTRWEAAEAGKLHPGWKAEAHHKIMVLGFEYIDWFVGTPNDTPEAKYKTVGFRVWRDGEYIAQLRKAEIDFWETYVVKDINPSDHKLKLVRGA